MKHALILTMVSLLSIGLFACDNTSSSESSVSSEVSSEVIDPLANAKAILNQEEERAFLYFWNTSNTNPTSPGYGLSRDRYSGNATIASIASVGFSLGAIPIGVENGWITHEEGEARVLGTLNTLQSLTRTHGFFFHFINLYTGLRQWNSEVSIIDTGLMLAGAIVAGQYFGGEVMTKVNEIYDAVEWNWYVNVTTNEFYMGYSPETGFGGSWSHMAEQMILYVLAAGSDTHPTTDALYKKIKRTINQSYKGTYTSSSLPGESVEEFYYSYDGSLFQHQFSHAFIDFRNIRDFEGTDWFENATRATKANYLYTQDYAHRYNTYGPDSWGLSACDGPTEYRAYGAQPAKGNSQNGTIALYASVASVNYLEEEALTAVEHYYGISQLWGTYGFKDAYNLGPVDDAYNPTIAAVTPWYDSDYVGIDKGVSVLMIENYRSNLIWEQFMANENIITGLNTLGFVAA